jgi:hypothetical protein
LAVQQLVEFDGRDNYYHFDSNDRNDSGNDHHDDSG